MAPRRFKYGSAAWQQYWNNQCHRSSMRVARNIDKMNRIRRANEKTTRRRNQLGCIVEMFRGRRVHSRTIKKLGRPRKNR